MTQPYFVRGDKSMVAGERIGPLITELEILRNNIEAALEGVHTDILAVSGGGGGDVVGPAVATADDIVLFDGTTGKLVKGGATKLSDLVANTLFDTQSILIATTDNTPLALNVLPSRIVGRKSSGNIVGMTAAEMHTLLNITNGADVTNATTVNAAGAVMETDYNANTLLTADSNDTPAALTVAASRILGRKASGGITGMTASETKTVLAIDDAEVSAAGSGTNYTPLGPTVDQHLSAIDLALGSISGGDVVGPGSATADNIATFDGTTGKLIKDGGSKVSDLVNKGGDTMTGALVLPRIIGPSSAGVRVGTSGTADGSSVLDLASTTKGFLPPRMTRAQMVAIGSPVEGLVVFNTIDDTLMTYDGSVWRYPEGHAYRNLIAGTDFTTTAASASSITMSVDWTAEITPGMALKIVNNTNTYYAVCEAITPTLLTILGPRLSTTATHQTEVSYGPNVHVHQVALHVPGNWCTAVGTNLLRDVASSAAFLDLPDAYLVGGKFFEFTVSGSPAFNIGVGAAAGARLWSDVGGLVVTGTRTTTAGADVDVSKYLLTRGDEIFVECQASVVSGNAILLLDLMLVEAV